MWLVILESHSVQLLMGNIVHEVPCRNLPPHLAKKDTREYITLLPEFFCTKNSGELIMPNSHTLFALHVLSQIFW